MNPLVALEWLGVALVAVILLTIVGLIVSAFWAQHEERKQLRRHAERKDGKALDLHFKTAIHAVNDPNSGK